METLAYTISGVTTEVSLAALGVTRVRSPLATHSPSSFTLILDGIPPETGIPIPFETPCVIHTGRTGSGGEWSGGSILFQGRRTDNPGDVSGEHVTTSIVIEDLWYDLKQITLMAVWPVITGGTIEDPVLTNFSWPDCILFQATAGVTYDPEPAYTHITTGQAITEILNYAISVGVNLQIGEIDPAAYVPFYPVRSMRIAAALEICLRVHPDCATEIDYTTTPPTFNIRRQSNLTALTLPYKGRTVVDGVTTTHLTSSVKPRPELVPTRVAIFLKETSTINNQRIIALGTDIYPAEVPTGLRSFDTDVDLTGPKISDTIAPLTSADFDPTDLTWWATKLPALADVANGGQLPNSGAGALTLLNSAVNDASLKCIQVVDPTGAAIDLDTFAYELTAGTVCSWMQLADDGGPVQVVEATIKAYFSYEKSTSLGNSTLTDGFAEHIHSVRVKLTNSPTATYSLSQTLATGEEYPGGLAQAVYESLENLQYSFRHEILETPFTTLVKPGKHALNLSGGAAAWETMAAMIQSVEYEFFFDPVAGLTTAKIEISCGPVAHLEPGQLVALFNLFTNRDLNKINPNERSSDGMLNGGQNAQLSSDTTAENSSPAAPVPTTINFYAPDAVNTGYSNVITLDATTAQITVAQNNNTTGANLTTGVVAVIYNGTGAPSATTLPANTYYRQYARYFDTTTPTAPIEYVCMTAGTNAASVWSQLGVSFQLIHCVVANAPATGMASGSACSSGTRTFKGVGPPTGSTLAYGNGRYNGVNSGFIYSVNLFSGGTGNNVGDVITLGGGTFTTATKITVDAVASGAVTGFHVSTVGVYSVYPNGAWSMTATTGSGSGVDFTFNNPPPDYYIDITTPTSPVLYICNTGGTNATSVWNKITTGGGGLIAMYDASGGTAYAGGSIVIVASQTTLSGIVIQPGTYGLLSSLSVPASPTGNQIPQIPVPATGTIYWIPIAAGLVVASTCDTGTTETIYANATGQF